MVKVNISKDSNVINRIKISGHAAYKEHGEDIVCSAISSIAITTINALVRYDNECIEYLDVDGLIDLTILKHDRTIDLLIENMIDLLKELEKKYNKNIKIK